MVFPIIRPNHNGFHSVWLVNERKLQTYDNIEALKTAIREKLNQLDSRTCLKATRAIKKRAQNYIQQWSGGNWVFVVKIFVVLLQVDVLIKNFKSNVIVSVNKIFSFF